MPKLIDFTGQTFGRWTVLHRARIESKNVTYWQCLCACGQLRDIPIGNLQRGLSKSCGCLKKELRTIHGAASRKERSKLYSVWAAMNSRCHNPNTKHFYNYGGRGISVCARWRHDFSAWRDDMGPQPTPQHTVDRINNNGNYEPGNCRWASRKEQSANRRIPKSARLLTYNGETCEMTTWARKTGIKVGTLYARLKSGWPLERALTTTTWNR